MVTNATQCITLPDDISFEDGSTLIVNPLAALGLIDRVKGLKAKAAI